MILAGALRFGWAGVNSFAGDEARISLDALRMRDELVMAGQPSSVNIPFFPLSVWIYAIPYRLSSDPLLATLFTAALNVGAVIGVWALARTWGAGSGWIAALFMASSPYAVLYSRSIWQPNLLAPLATLWLWLAYQAWTQTGRRRTLAISACVAVGLSVVQVHFAGVALILGTAYLFVRLQWWRAFVPVLIGAGIAALFAVPYLYYITVIDPDVLARFGGVAGSAAQISADGFANLIRLGLGWDWGYLGLGEFDIYSRHLFPALLSAVLLIAGIVGIGRMISLKTPPRIQGGETTKSSAWRTERRLRDRFASSFSELGLFRSTGFKPRADLSEPPVESVAKHQTRILAELTLVLLIVSPIFFLRHTSPVLIHYQLIALPAIALIAGASLRAARRLMFPLMLVLFVLVVIWMGQIGLTLGRVAVQRPPNSALSSILSESRTVAYTVDPPFLMFTHGDVPALDGEVAVFEALLWDRPHRVVNGDVLLILPPHPATLIATLAPFQMWEELEAAGLTLNVSEYPRRARALPFMAATYDGVSDPAGFTPIDPVTFADGTTLEGYRVRWVGNRFRVSTLWRVTGELAAGTVQQFNHLRTAETLDGEPFMGSDVPLSLHTWQSGDRVIVMADFFDVPPGDGYTLDVGHYTLADFARIPRVDGDTFVRVEISVPPQ